MGGKAVGEFGRDLGEGFADGDLEPLVVAGMCRSEASLTLGIR